MFIVLSTVFDVKRTKKNMLVYVINCFSHVSSVSHSEFAAQCCPETLSSHHQNDQHLQRWEPRGASASTKIGAVNPIRNYPPLYQKLVLFLPSPNWWVPDCAYMLMFLIVFTTWCIPQRKQFKHGLQRSKKKREHIPVFDCFWISPATLLPEQLDAQVG